MAHDTQGDPEDGALELARREARETLEAQLSTLDDIDAKALSVFRLNVAVVGVLLSVLSFAASSDAAVVTAFLTPATGASVGLFVLSAATAGLTYTAGGQVVGVGPSDLAVAGGQSKREYLSRLVDSYATWIRANMRTNSRKALLVTLSLLGTVAGVLALGVAVVAAFTGAGGPAAVAAVVILVVLALLGDLHGQLRRVRSEPSRDDLGTVAPESLEGGRTGQRTFKGRDRHN